ncbi:NAD-dependent epimerase/dehydratase family protein [Candidatus Nitrospira allomarina]|jgi:UDP-glucose 4-epimerase|uniref:NAD-dependent epimerase/dehydratase family protein n=1 Tax=Candidatus Nitrospira allomarina TaxID=3020900 RepID=A0AA96GD45_9BACT|nr:NAD-dependent epimerase/dehydratase family protein [Candidatus Nitrospira allomarina]WNM59391.1 NAD-dependent epimerase/dehydratase family protein [Candidatus Nitrospira allomarina]
MSTKILVTGGAGFIGSHLVDRLIQEGNEVIVVDNLSTGKRKNVNKKAQFYKMDIQSKRIERVFRNERPLIVVHLAAQMSVRHSTDDPGFDAQVNILGTINVLEHAVKQGVRKVTFASSGGVVYGEQEIFPAPESHRTEPLSPYGISKLAGEKYLAYYANATGLRYVALRFANVYGPRQDSEGEAGVVAIFSKQMLDGGQPIVNGTGKQTRDFIYVDDAVEAILVTLGEDVRGIFNVGTGQETTINECYGIIKSLTKCQCKELYGAAKKGEQFRSVLDVTKLREVFGWDPQVTLQEGLTRTVDFFRGTGN